MAEPQRKNSQHYLVTYGLPSLSYMVVAHRARPASKDSVALYDRQGTGTKTIIAIGDTGEIIPASQEVGNDRIICVSVYSASLPAHHCKLIAQPLPDRMINASPCNGYTRILKMLHTWANLPAQDLLCTIFSPREASFHRSKGPYRSLHR